MMALPPCHYAWNVTVIDNKVNLFWAQRSADLMLGVPFNISSYALLLSLLAKDAGLEVGNLSACFVDCHIYENQIDGAKQQILREPGELPRLVIEGDDFDIFSWTHDNAKLDNYNPQEAIKFGDVVV
jgi:thymidylate synthase